MIENYLLVERVGLPSELQFLLDKYPHAVWKGHPNMSGLLRFWVSKHQEFNRVCADLTKTNQGFYDGSITPSVFQQTIAPNIKWLLSEFAEHHHIEDHFTFPAFRCAEPKLNSGFDILDADHLALNICLQRLTGASNDFMQCSNRNKLPKLGETIVIAIDQLARQLKRHLMDEEDIVIPLFLDRGEKILHSG